MPKLTAEEKKERALQKKIQKELEAQRAARQIHKDHLDREMKYTQLNLKKLNKRYRAILIRLKNEELKKNITAMTAQFNKVMDVKNYLIDLLVEQLDHARMQYEYNFSFNVECVDKIIHFFHSVLEDLRRDYTNSMTDLRTLEADIIASLKENSDHHEKYLNEILFNMELKFTEAERNIRTDYFSRIDEATSKNNSVTEALKMDLENILNGVWNEYMETFYEYEKNTADCRKEYVGLRQRDTRSFKLFKTQITKINSFHDIIRKLRDHYSDRRDYCERKIDDLYHEREFFAGSFWTIKSRMENEREHDFTQMAVLTCEGNNTMEYLKRLLKKAEHILNLTTICRKLETRGEKIDPFDDAMLADVGRWGSLTPSISPVSPPEIDFDPADAFVVNIDIMQRFWRRMANADAMRYGLLEEKEYLRRENMYLKKHLQLYCEELNGPNHFLPPIEQHRTQQGD